MSKTLSGHMFDRRDFLTEKPSLLSAGLHAIPPGAFLVHIEGRSLTRHALGQAGGRIHRCGSPGASPSPGNVAHHGRDLPRGDVPPNLFD